MAWGQRTVIGMATWVGCAIAAATSLGCTTKASPPIRARWTLAEHERTRLAQDVEGTWVTTMITGDAVAVTTELRLQRGHATELRRTTSIVGPSTVDVIANGHYRITESGALDVLLQSPQGARRTSSSISVVRGWPGVRDPPAEYLLLDAFRPRDVARRAFGFERAVTTGSSPTSAERVVVDLEFASPLPVVVAGTTTCVVELTVHAQLGAATAHENHTMPCRTIPRSELGLVEIVLATSEELSFVSDLRRRGREGELVTLLENSVDRSVFVDPTRPDVLLRGSVGFGPRSAWSRRLSTSDTGD